MYKIYRHTMSQDGQQVRAVPCTLGARFNGNSAARILKRVSDRIAQCTSRAGFGNSGARILKRVSDRIAQCTSRARFDVILAREY